jgi:hypothetical protein
VGAIHLAHAAGADRTVDAVGTEPRPGLQRHRRRL